MLHYHPPQAFLLIQPAAPLLRSAGPQAFLLISMMAEKGATPYSLSTPLLPPGVKSLGGARWVSTTRHHFWPPGGGGSLVRTSYVWALKARYRSPHPAGVTQVTQVAC
jgi:hypothetical protein